MRRFWSEHRGTILHWSMEIVVVMIGVLLALGVQQWAEGRAATQRAVEAEDRIRQELLVDGGYLLERIGLYPCLKQRLNELKDGVVDGDAGWRPVPLPGNFGSERVFGRVYGVPLRPLSDDVYRAVGNSGDLAAVMPDRLTGISQTYGVITGFAELNREEQRLAAGLVALKAIGAGDAPSRRAVIADLAQLDTNNYLALVTAQQTMGALQRLGYRYTPAEARAALADFRETITGGKARYGDCYDVRGAMTLYRQLLPAGKR